MHPTFMDFRGRIYPTPNYLSYQGGDLARSLIVLRLANIDEIQNIDSIIKYTLTEEKADCVAEKYNKKVKLLRSVLRLRKIILLRRKRLWFR